MIGFWPALIRLPLLECNDIFPILGEVSWPIVQQREDVIGGVPRVDAVLFIVVTVSSHSLSEVPLLARLDVVSVDGNEAVPVRPGVLMHKAEGVEKLVDRGHQAHLETATETGTFERK